MDFCCVHGKSHDHRGYYLTKTNKPFKVEVSPEVVEEHIIINGIIFKRSFLEGYKNREGKGLW